MSGWSPGRFTDVPRRVERWQIIGGCPRRRELRAGVGYNWHRSALIIESCRNKWSQSRNRQSADDTACRQSVGEYVGAGSEASGCRFWRSSRLREDHDCAKSHLQYLPRGSYAWLSNLKAASWGEHASPQLLAALDSIHKWPRSDTTKIGCLAMVSLGRIFKIVAVTEFEFEF